MRREEIGTKEGQWSMHSITVGDMGLVVLVDPPAVDRVWKEHVEGRQ